jgi:hypothetical protein
MAIKFGCILLVIWINRISVPGLSPNNQGSRLCDQKTDNTLSDDDLLVPAEEMEE